jgi:NAD(P)-dependent dehydrogenase (short-subunit alcohol dehydrogenase family)
MIILITGASMGIGRATANHLTQLGHRVYGTSRQAFGEQVAFQTLIMDVTSEESVRQAVETIVAQEGKLDVLINNAGLGIVAALEEVPEEMARQIFDTNVWGVLRTCRAVLPTMRAQGHGLIINVSSIAGMMGLPCRGIYSASKAAVEMITETLSIETRAFGVRVCSVLPGDVKTNINQNRLVALSGEESPYRALVARMNAQVNAEVSAAAEPLYIAKAIEKILKTPTPRIHYVAGPPFQKLAIWLKGRLPSRLFERILFIYYGIK